MIQEQFLRLHAQVLSQLFKNNSRCPTAESVYHIHGIIFPPIQTSVLSLRLNVLFAILIFIYELFETLLTFIVCIMFMFICSALPVIQLLHATLGAVKAFRLRAWLLLFHSLLQMFLIIFIH